MKAKIKKINIKKMNLEYLSLNELREFQEEIKFLSQENEIKLNKVLDTEGLKFPFYAYKHEHINYLIDGHQRLKILKEKFDNNTKVPVVFIEFDNKEEAKEAILLASSSYGDFRFSKLEDFFNLNSINDDFVFNLNIKDNNIFDFLNSEEIFKEDKKKPIDLNYKENLVFELIIECGSEKELKETFNKISNEGYKCRILTY